MVKRLMILPLMLIFIMAACPSLGQAQSLNDSTNETNIRDAISPPESPSLGDESIVSGGTEQNDISQICCIQFIIQ